MPGDRGYFRCIRTSKMRPEWEVRDVYERLIEVIWGGLCQGLTHRTEKKGTTLKIRRKGN